MIGVAYFFGAVSGIFIGFVACAALMFRERITQPEQYEHVDGDGR